MQKIASFLEDYNTFTQTNITNFQTKYIKVTSKPLLKHKHTFALYQRLQAE